MATELPACFCEAARGDLFAFRCPACEREDGRCTCTACRERRSGTALAPELLAAIRDVVLPWLTPLATGSMVFTGAPAVYDALCALVARVAGEGDGA